ncbi:hypothetical protein DUNSADRAFT_9661 [Dunaliella salina]|uniref:Uncharacterized protein n=1 Tax=Dunaliella salina TaxID=3046 RepID=A0ABQ7FSD4_DUNSA|nr:hypothetical protein DUNSADRAFT_9661 [Dunaliella salina]|eukprot:KAF5825466.1 hypothetical protein DUNSADRAFT_9661 [Dunaliella salina]
MLLQSQSQSTLRPIQSRDHCKPCIPVMRHCQPFRPSVAVQAAEKEEARASEDASSSPSTSADGVKIDKELSKITTKTAATFAPRSSTAKGKNPAQPGTALYDIFEYQAWLSLAAGGLLSFNIMFPSDEPSIPRLLG